MPRARRGATTVEMAFCLPVYFLTVMFFFEAWRLMEFQHTVDQAAFEGARAAIVPGATAQSARDRAKAILNTVGVGDTATVTINPTTLTAATPSVTCTVSLNYNQVGWFFRYFPVTKVLTSTLTLDHENTQAARRGT
jgi:Flp pilus assembly protein TadG